MKHIKLFEQFIDPFDPFGEEIKSKNDDIIREGDMVIFIDDSGVSKDIGLNYPLLNREYVVSEIQEMYLKVRGARGVWKINRFKKI